MPWNIAHQYSTCHVLALMSAFAIGYNTIQDLTYPSPTLSIIDKSYQAQVTHRSEFCGFVDHPPAMIGAKKFDPARNKPYSAIYLPLSCVK